MHKSTTGGFCSCDVIVLHVVDRAALYLFNVCASVIDCALCVVRGCLVSAPLRSRFRSRGRYTGSLNLNASLASANLLTISRPVAVNHEMHVTFDKATGQCVLATFCFRVNRVCARACVEAIAILS